MRQYLLRVDGVKVEFPEPLPVQSIATLLEADTLDSVVLTRSSGFADLVMMVDDQGIYKELEINHEATKLYHAICVPGTTAQIHGPVFICHDQDFA